jgi:hypothetical protein
MTEKGRCDRAFCGSRQEGLELDAKSPLRGSLLRANLQNCGTVPGIARCQRRSDFAAAGRSKSAARTRARRPPISRAFLLAVFHS